MTDEEYEKLSANINRSSSKISPLDVLFVIAVLMIVVWLVWFVWEQHAAIERQHQEQKALLQRCTEDRANERYWNCRKDNTK